MAVRAVVFDIGGVLEIVEESFLSQDWPAARASGSAGSVGAREREQQSYARLGAANVGGARELGMCAIHYRDDDRTITQIEALLNNS